METDLNFWLQLAVMLVCIGVGVASEVLVLVPQAAWG